jgi:MYXO-CTERM domain-containing protein
LNGIAANAQTERVSGCNTQATSPSDPNNCYYQADTPTQLTAALGTIVQKITSDEVCDGIDNNCNGQIDEGLTVACTSCNGGTGYSYCVNGQMTQCDAPGPTAEICNGVDDNCNGQIDENLTMGCGNQYCPGVQRCQAGSWGSCSARAATSETAVPCDGIDNDCNGIIDDGQTCNCSAGQTQACGVSNQGQCKLGSRSCISTGSGYVWGNCNGEIDPQAEVCDGLDNNCNGQIDDGADGACTTACGPGTRACVGGMLAAACTPSNPPPEVCDGVDNNCNGQIDENSDKSCMTRCGAGVQKCVNGSLQTCQALNPPKEVCDGIDNNCDGVVDEGCACKQGDQQPCHGACGDGYQTCEYGKWSSCIGADNGRAEECNGRDDDCDGMIDEDDGPTPICGAGSVCVCGNCATKCDSKGQCNNGGSCVLGLCQIDYCPEGQCCKEGACADGVCEVPKTGSPAPQVQQQAPQLEAKRGVIKDGCGCKSDNDPVAALPYLLLALFLLRRRSR